MAKKILVVDDDLSVRKVFKDLLQYAGFEPVVFENPTELLWAFMTESPDTFSLIITDKNMPQMEGDQLAKEIRGVNESIPILMITSELLSEAPDGVTAVLSKPVPSEIFFENVHALLDGK